MISQLHKWLYDWLFAKNRICAYHLSNQLKALKRVGSFYLDYLFVYLAFFLQRDLFQNHHCLNITGIHFLALLFSKLSTTCQADCKCSFGWQQCSIHWWFNSFLLSFSFFYPFAFASQAAPHSILLVLTMHDLDCIFFFLALWKPEAHNFHDWKQLWLQFLSL